MNVSKQLKKRYYNKFIMEKTLSFEEQSFRNLIHFYSDGLRRIMKGENAQKIFSHNERHRLGKYGIITHVRKPGSTHKTPCLSDQTLEVMESMEKSGEL